MANTSRKKVKLKRQKFSNNQLGDFIDINAKQEKPVPIKVATDPLDTYRSPHLLDLSQSKFIEKVRPSLKYTDYSYTGLPGGDILAKLYIFQLLSFDQSEILSIIKYFIGRVKRFVRGLFRQVDFSPKLPLITGDDRAEKRIMMIYEISFVNFIWHLWSIVSQGWMLAYKLLAVDRLNNIKGVYLKLLKGTEVINFKLMPAIAPDPVSSMTNLTQSQPSSKFFVDDDNGLREVRVSKFNFSLPWAKIFQLKTALALSALALMVVLPLKAIDYWQSVNQVRGRVLGEAEQALFSLSQAENELKDFNFISAQSYFSNATDNFITARNQLGEIRSFLTVLAESMPLSNTYKSGKSLLNLGEYLSLAGEHLLQGVNQLSEESDAPLTDRLKNFKLSSQSALAELKLAEQELNKINLRHLPSQNQEDFIILKNKLPQFIVSLEKSGEMLDFLIAFLGDDDLRRYLLVFQNDNELRATGGFMGSFALADIQSGELKNLHMPGGGTYDLRSGLHELLQSPQPMQLANPRWEFQDANWWPDWPKSAENIKWFYEKSDGPTVDGVIAINSDWMADLFNVIGPIELPNYNKVIRADNFEDEIQLEVEIDYDDKTKPKKILGDLAPEILDRLLKAEPHSIADLAGALIRGLNRKDILIYLGDDSLNEFVSNLGWSGQIKSSDLDYLYVTATNIGGGKTDGVIDQQIYHQSRILTDGSIINTVLIRRHHFGPIDDNFTIVANRSYLRVFVPQGSQLIEASGFNQPLSSEFRVPEDYLLEDDRLVNENRAEVHQESQTKIYDELGKTVFANWLTINPGQSQDLLLVYRLPFKLKSLDQNNSSDGFIDRMKNALMPASKYSAYSLLVQKQPGSNEDKFVSQVVYPDDFRPNIVYPSDGDREASQVMFNNKLDQDRLYFISFSAD